MWCNPFLRYRLSNHPHRVPAKSTLRACAKSAAGEKSARHSLSHVGIETYKVSRSFLVVLRS